MRTAVTTALQVLIVSSSIGIGFSRPVGDRVEDLATRQDAAANALNCDLTRYKPVPGLTAAIERADASRAGDQTGPPRASSDDSLVVTWMGDRDNEVRVRFGIDAGQPLIRELAIRKTSGPWTVVGRNLTPEFHVTSGRRRIGGDQLNPMRALGLISPEAIEREKWNAFWDAPLNVPGMTPGLFGGSETAALMDLPRRPDEIRRATATYRADRCEVKTDGARIEVVFPGLSMGIFSGRLQFTVYKGTNLIRQEAIAKTDEPSVAYKYAAGLSGFSTTAQRVAWRDTGGDWQKYEFGGTPNSNPVPLRARNRLAIVEGPGASIAVFPPPHKFFFSREVEVNLGYVWYRKNDSSSFAVGVRHSDNEEMFRPIGVNTPWLESRITQARRFAEGNFALYNAPPGTWQRMAAYFYVNPEAATRTQEAVLAFTNGDRFRPLAGYQTMMTHIHSPFSMEMQDAGTLDEQPPWIPAVKARGIDIVMMSDYHADGHARDAGPIRLAELQQYYEGTRRHSDRAFAIVPSEEPWSYLGGHWNIFFPKPVFWTQVRGEGQPFVEDHPVYGKLYHVGSAADVLELLKRENGIAWMAHQRTKSSVGYLEHIRNTDYFRSDRYIGAEYRANVPTDLSEKRMLEKVGLDALDDMNNWTADSGLRAKTLVAATDTYMKYPEDDIYPESYVNYVKLDRVPSLEDWSPLAQALGRGDFFVSSGEILLKQFRLEGAGAQRTVVAEFDWTFPLDFVEVVWGDGQRTDRQIISTTDGPPFGSKRFAVPLDTTGKKWVRVAAWDSAGNGAFSQPVRLTAQTSTASR